MLDNVHSTLSGAKNSVIAKPGKDDRAPEGAAADDTEELDEENGSILMGLIGQLRIGMDLQKVTLPTFVLEPRSMLERITVSIGCGLFLKKKIEKGNLENRSAGGTLWAEARRGARQAPSHRTWLTILVSSIVAGFHEPSGSHLWVSSSRRVLPLSYLGDHC